MRNIPNTISIFRILLIPFFVHHVIQEDMLAAAVILIISALTDMVDGFLARRFDWITDLGKILDPAADKLTQMVVCILFAIHLYQYWVFFVVLIFRDLAILAVSGYFIKNKVMLSGAKWFGKVSTTLFYVSMIIIAMFPALPSIFIYALLALTTICAFGAVLLYIPEFIRHKEQVKTAK